MSLVGRVVALGEVEVDPGGGAEGGGLGVAQQRRVGVVEVVVVHCDVGLEVAGDRSRESAGVGPLVVEDVGAHDVLDNVTLAEVADRLRRGGRLIQAGCGAGVEAGCFEIESLSLDEVVAAAGTLTVGVGADLEIRIDAAGMTLEIGQSSIDH